MFRYFATLLLFSCSQVLCGLNFKLSHMWLKKQSYRVRLSFLFYNWTVHEHRCIKARESLCAVWCQALTGRRVCWAWVWLVREVWGSVPRSCYEARRDGARAWASPSGAELYFHCSESPSASSQWWVEWSPCSRWETRSASSRTRAWWRTGRASSRCLVGVKEAWGRWGIWWTGASLVSLDEGRTGGAEEDLWLNTKAFWMEGGVEVEVLSCGGFL